MVESVLEASFILFSNQQFHVAKEGVRVFSQASREESFILDVKTGEGTPDLKDVADQLLGKVVFVSWPHLIEAMVSFLFFFS